MILILGEMTDPKKTRLRYLQVASCELSGDADGHEADLTYVYQGETHTMKVNNMNPEVKIKILSDSGNVIMDSEALV